MKNRSKIVYARELYGKPYAVKAQEKLVVCRDLHGKTYVKQVWSFKKEGKNHVVFD